ncbi:CRISP-associated protein Cas1 [Peptoclostridium litorale DSM 5388]|uniref:CRISPR-associated endonuclease Cas1 n=1 Tax=Peptoclostridium litorale DSM 5388 TaxID=1121324 RepID=A0A069RIX2_PEPLI|nr:type I-C CRISPR-associated endonuclease Cas1c [Peptoclostridium litorale]KDR96748.1 CRISPR-associated endonuclease Cas1 [Peptoclostridium litorale DSM 5388]SIO34874.1 CRISP-associated protein Cas1 [Peptoclostridium litorale DSM 5388]
MKKLLNVLYVTTPDSYLSRDGENVVIKVKNLEKFRMPIHNLEGIICFGYTGASPSLMALCAERNVGLSFLSENGHFYARVTGKTTGNVILRREQYRQADNLEKALDVARNCITAKIGNSRTVLKRSIRDHSSSLDSDKLKRVCEGLTYKIDRIERCSGLDELRGVEGDAAREYYSAFDELILCQKEAFYMKERTRRPPMDNMNALLSFLYTILAHDVQSAIESVGLDPYVGFLHRDRPGRAGLALDIMEELRPYLADRVALTLINRRQITEKGFVKKESGGIIMDKDTRKQVLLTWQKRKQDKIMHPFLGEKIQVGLLPYAQALLMARFLRGDLDGYPPFLCR